MGFLAGSLGLVNFVFSSILCCMTLPRFALIIIVKWYFILGMFSILMLVGLASDICKNVCDCTTCSLSMAPGARIAIAASSFFVVAGVATIFLEKKGEPVAPAQKAEDEAKDEEQALPPEPALASSKR